MTKQEARQAKHYLETGILGAYETAKVKSDEIVSGKFAPLFDDALLVVERERTLMKREMVVEGKVFRVTSVLPLVADSPTKRLLKLVDAELEKGRD